MLSVTDTLRSSPLFKGFTDVGLEAIAGIAVVRNFPRGTPLFVENMVGDSMLIIGLGNVRISAKSPAGADVPLGELGPGAWLGEVSLLKEGPRMCTAQALTDVTAVELRASDFQKLLAQKPQACVKLLMRIVTHFGEKVRDNRESLRSLLGRL
ncbi:MAG: cyclic nucleotide-binding domain-containing protein [Myxococcaceae bacterium]|nr:cyclic nucleotide-binding domain-containing protein [Myxococcaceae bacterium]MCI0673167.1 cyclic nucleotide-binding domain-containing protein [Myxococcaceae bacterium]